MTIKCIIIDDEPLAAMLLEGYLAKTPYLELLASFSSAVEAIHSTQLADADLIFCDIQMPMLNGLEFSRMVNERSRIIFTTAFNEYALDGYRVNALDYLTKPISYNDFIGSTQKALDWFEMRRRAEQQEQQEQQEPQIEEATEIEGLNCEDQAIEPSIDSIYVKSDYKLLRIDLSKLIYIEGLKDYVKFIVEGSAKPILSLMNLGRVEQMLPSSQFIRVHRSFIVRRDKIEVIERNRILFGRESIPIGENFKASLKDYLNERTL